MDNMIEDDENLKLVRDQSDVPEDYQLVEIEDITKLEESDYGQLRSLVRKAIKDGTIRLTRKSEVDKAKGACIVSADEGEAAEYRGNCMGLYRRLDGASYQQVGGSWFLYRVLPERHWYISEKLMKRTGLVMINTTGSSSVPASGWQYLDAAGEMRADALLRVRLCGQEEELQCRTITITSSQCTQQEALGIFTRIPGDILNGVPVFRNTHNLYLRVPTGDSTWGVSDERDGGGWWLTSGRATSCPAHPSSGLSRRLNTKHWLHVDGNNLKEDPTLQLNCNVHY